MIKQHLSLVKILIHSLFKLFGFNDIDKDGIITTITNLIYTKVGRKNGITREKWLEKTIGQIPSGKSILDAGAGELKYKTLCNHLKYTSQDLGEYDGIGTHEGIQMGSWDNSKLDIKSDITNIPVPDKSFDVIMCIEVFEHISEPALAVKEFARIIRPGGRVIITAPFCSITHFAPFYFANGYSKYWYEKVLIQNGFTIEEIYFNGNFYEYLAQEIRNIKTVAVRYSKVNTKWWICFRLAEIIMLHALSRLSNKDKGSNELLCFGLHIIASKNN